MTESSQNQTVDKNDKEAEAAAISEVDADNAEDKNKWNGAAKEPTGK